MFSPNIISLFLGCLVFITIHFATAQLDTLLDGDSLQNTISTLGGILGIAETDIAAIVQDPLTIKLCNMDTEELIKYYGYIAERHYVTTKDGYILTIFRCNSKNKTFTEPKKAVVLQHGILESSDDFCINTQERALAYVLADAGYDVWIVNARGSYYSRNHTDLSPYDPEFWDFTWYEIGEYDNTATYEYITKLTNNTKVFVVGHSQGTTSTMAVLSDFPKVNDLIHAASFMAPVAFMNNSGSLYQLWSKFHIVTEILLKNKEFLPRGAASKVAGTLCSLELEPLCNAIFNFLFGQSKEERNDILPAFICHVPSGCSYEQIRHYGMLVRCGYFGKKKEGSCPETPKNFNLTNIRIPLSLHWSRHDELTNPIDFERLRVQLSNKTLVQEVKQFNHIDFMWSNNAAKIVYSEIVKFFNSIVV